MPHIGAVNLQKVGAFGRVVNKTVYVDDLEHVAFDEVSEKGTSFFRNRKLLLEHQLQIL